MTDQTSRRTRRRHSAEFKAKVIVAALREDKTLNQLSTELGVHPVVISDWKQQALGPQRSYALMKVEPAGKPIFG